MANWIPRIFMETIPWKITLFVEPILGLSA